MTNGDSAQKEKKPLSRRSSLDLSKSGGSTATCAGCKKSGIADKLQCPECQEAHKELQKHGVDYPAAFFCSAKCFKDSQAKHKACHKYRWHEFKSSDGQAVREFMTDEQWEEFNKGGGRARMEEERARKRLEQLCFDAESAHADDNAEAALNKGRALVGYPAGQQLKDDLQHLHTSQDSAELTVVLGRVLAAVLAANGGHEPHAHDGATVAGHAHAPSSGHAPAASHASRGGAAASRQKVPHRTATYHAIIRHEFSSVVHSLAAKKRFLKDDPTGTGKPTTALAHEATDTWHAVLGRFGTAPKLPLEMKGRVKAGNEAADREAFAALVPALHAAFLVAVALERSKVVTRGDILRLRPDEKKVLVHDLSAIRAAKFPAFVDLLPSHPTVDEWLRADSARTSEAFKALHALRRHLVHAVVDAEAFAVVTLTCFLLEDATGNTIATMNKWRLEVGNVLSPEGLATAVRPPSQ